MTKVRSWRIQILYRILVLAVVWSLQFFALHKAVAQETVTIGVVTWAGFGNAFIANERKYWPKLKVEIKVVDDARAREASFAGGQLDIMISSADLFAQETSNGIAGKMVLVTDVSSGGDGIVAKNDISNLAGLRGRKVAVTIGAPSQFLLYKLLNHFSTRLADLRLIQVDDPQKAAEVFMSGDVDAAVTWEPFLSQAAGRPGAKILATSKDAPDTIVDLLIASPKLLAKRAVLEEFVTGWLRAAEDIRANRPGVTSAMAKGFNASNDDIDGMLAGIKIAGYRENAAYFSGPSGAQTQVGKLFTEAGKLWVSLGLIKEAANPNAHIELGLHPLFEKGGQGQTR